MREKSAKSVKELFQLFPQHLISDIGKEMKIDKNVSRLYGDLMFKLLVFTSIRSDKMSTRILEEVYNSPFFQAMSGKGNHQTRHSSIADRLTTMDYRYFEKIFEWSVENFSKMIPAKSKLLQRIKRFDSTLVSISSALVDWGMKVGRPPQTGHPMVQVKFTMGMHASLPSSIQTFFDQKHLSEETALREGIEKSRLNKGDIVVFDRGLKSRLTFKLFDEQGIKFVTSGGKNIRYKELEIHRQIKGRKADGLKFLRDSKVELYRDGHVMLEYEFRLVEVEIIETGKRLVFITNIWDLSAMQIARIYKHRWDIEVFFRFMKQQLNIKHLINRTENGVKIQIFVALISAMMLLTYKVTNKISSYLIAKMRFEENLFMLIFEQLQVDSFRKLNIDSGFT